MRSSEKSETGREAAEQATEQAEHPATEPAPSPEPGLYFFPDQEVPESRARSLLQHGSHEERAWVISHLLRFAQWDDLWTYVSRDQVREIFPRLELPEKLRSAWARMLKIEAPVAS